MLMVLYKLMKWRYHNIMSAFEKNVVSINYTLLICTCIIIYSVDPHMYNKHSSSMYGIAEP